MDDDDDLELLDEASACLLLGGGVKAISRASLWRGIDLGYYSKPVKISPAMNRWRPKQLRRDLARIIRKLNNEAA